MNITEGRELKKKLLTSLKEPAFLKKAGLTKHAMLTDLAKAGINRLTALFRVHRFYDKQLYAVIVSGYSGGDIVAEQLISALNMNKSFYLPPRFAMMRTANDPGAITQHPNIREEAKQFAEHMMAELNESVKRE